MHINWRRHCWSYCLLIEGQLRRHTSFPSPELRPARFIVIVDLLTTRVVARQSQRKRWEHCQREQRERSRRECLHHDQVLPFPGTRSPAKNRDGL